MVEYSYQKNAGGDIMHRKDILQGLSMLTQLGVSVALPPILCIFAGIWIQKKWGIGDWVIVVSLLVGLISGACNFASFIRTAKAKVTEKEDENDETGEGR